MTLATLPQWAAALIAEGRVGRLGFLDADDQPRVLPVTYAAVGDVVWTAIDRKRKRTLEPARVRWLRRRPEAALVVDRYSDDWEELAWVQLLGRVEVLEGQAAEPGRSALAAKYEQYATQPPPGPVLRLKIERALHWRASPAER